MEPVESIAGLGTLSPDSRIAEWWVSGPVLVPLFRGTSLPFVMIVPPVDGRFAPDVIEAVQHFLALGDGDRLAASDRVYKNYVDFMDATDLEPLGIEQPSEIWRFVTPFEVMIDRRGRRDGDVYVRVACECEWEPEHGLQLVFRGGRKLVRVSEQDGHLTHADAYDVPDTDDEWLA